jgi:hypothetical protein
MKMKKLMVAALAAAITVGSALPASAAWVQSGSDWRYQNEDGSWQANKWFQEDGKWYHFDANSNAQKGWFKDTDGKWYFFAYNGIMQTGLLKVDDKVYYMNADGSLFSGAMKIGGVEYNFTEYGTTNGKPSVGASQTFGGNGNQTNVIVGGGGYSSSGGGSSSGGNKTVDSAEVTAVKEAVKEAFNKIKSDLVIEETIDDVKVIGTAINFTYKDSTTGPNTNVSEAGLIGVVQNALSDILDSGEVSKVKVGNKEFTAVNSTDFTEYAENLGYGDKTVNDVIKLLKEKGITVYTSSNEKINYSVVAK